LHDIKLAGENCTRGEEERISRETADEERKGLGKKKHGEIKKNAKTEVDEPMTEQESTKEDYSESNPYFSIVDELSEDVEDMDSSDMAVNLRWLIFHNRLDTVMSLFITRCKVLFLLPIISR